MKVQNVMTETEGQQSTVIYVSMIYMYNVPVIFIDVFYYSCSSNFLKCRLPHFVEHVNSAKALREFQYTMFSMYMYVTKSR